MIRKGGPGREGDTVLVVATLHHEWEPFITWVITRLQRNDSVFLLHVIDCSIGEEEPCTGLCKVEAGDSPEMRCIRKRKKWLANTLAALGDYYSSTVVLTCTKVVHRMNLATTVKKQAQALNATRVIVSGAGCFTADPYDRHLTEEFLCRVQEGLTTDCLLLLVDNWRIADARRGTRGMLDDIDSQPDFLDAKWSRRKQLPAVTLPQCPSFDSVSGQPMSDTEGSADVSSRPQPEIEIQSGAQEGGVPPSITLMEGIGRTEEDLRMAVDEYIRTVEDDPFKIDLNSFKREIDSIFGPSTSSNSNANTSSSCDNTRDCSIAAQHDYTRYFPDADAFGRGVQLEPFGDPDQGTEGRRRVKSHSMNSYASHQSSEQVSREKHYDRSQSMHGTSEGHRGRGNSTVPSDTTLVNSTESTAKTGPTVSTIWVRTMASLLSFN